MINAASRTGFSRMVALLAVAIAPACVGEVGEVSGGDSQDEADEIAASFSLSTGQKVEFYDLGDTALVSETGLAGLPRVLNMPREISPDKLVDLWNEAAKGAPAPARLVSLQNRLIKISRRPGTALGAKLPVSTFDATGPQFDETPAGVPAGTLAAPDGCNNGCCDFAWLSTFIECGAHGGLDLDWFFFKRFSTKGWGDDAFHFRAMACAATGTSHWRVHIQGGRDKHWDIAQGFYRYVGSTGGIFDDPNVGSYVNEKAPFNMHTHCGVIAF